MSNNDIALLGINLSEGESLRTVCPLCLGGSDAEVSLSITRNDGLVWQCFRSKCGAKGSTNGATFSKHEPRKAKYKEWEGKTYELPEKVTAKIHAMWGITRPNHWYWTTDYGGRVAMSIRSPENQHRGWVLRSLNPGGTKALTYGEGPSWYLNHDEKPIWLVEDIPSAVRAAKYVNAVALLGTRISDDAAMELSSHSSGVVIALDQDATKVSFKLYNQYRGLWKRTRIQPLKKDLKNMTEAELKELLT